MLINPYFFKGLRSISHIPVYHQHLFRITIIRIDDMEDGILREIRYKQIVVLNDDVDR